MLERPITVLQFKDASKDVQEFFIFHIFLFVIPAVLFNLPDSDTLKTIIQISVFTIGIPILIYRSIQRRRKMDWKWPGVSFENIILSISILILVICDW